MEENRQRSRQYPGYGLEECAHWASMTRSELGSGPHDRESIAIAIGSKGLTGASTRKLGALVHFGLLKRESTGYALSQLSERITRPISEEERRQALVEAFLQPELYAEILERCKADGRIPTRLASILVRYHRIHDSAAEDAARIFVASGRFAGIIEDDGRIIELEPREDEQLPLGTALLSEATLSARAHMAPAPVSSVDDGVRTFRYPLTGGQTAELIVPATLTLTDIRLLRLALKSLALAYELEESTEEKRPENEQ